MDQGVALRNMKQKKTSSELVRILVLEDNPSDAKLVLHTLKKIGENTICELVSTEKEFKAKLDTHVYDIVCSDYRLKGWTGLEAFHWLRDLGYSTPFILVTGTLGDEQAVNCIREGITDYVLKAQMEQLPN